MPRTEIQGEQIEQETITGDQLKDTGVVPGTYTNAQVTTDADGRITSISNGTGTNVSLVIALIIALG